MKLNEIKKTVERFTKVSINNKSRQTKYKVPRFIYYYMARKYTFATYEEIAKTVKQTHATILNGHRKYESEVLSRPEYKKLAEDIERNIVQRVSVSELPEIEILQETTERTPLTDTQIVTFKDLLKLSDKDISEFRETRLKPYMSMLKSRRVHGVEKVYGARRNFNLKQI